MRMMAMITDMMSICSNCVDCLTFCKDNNLWSLMQTALLRRELVQRSHVKRTDIQRTIEKRSIQWTDVKRNYVNSSILKRTETKRVDTKRMDSKKTDTQRGLVWRGMIQRGLIQRELNVSSVSSFMIIGSVSVHVWLLCTVSVRRDVMFDRLSRYFCHPLIISWLLDIGFLFLSMISVGS